MAQRQRGGNDDDGQLNKDGNGWHDGEVVAMTVMDGVLATAIA